MSWFDVASLLSQVMEEINEQKCMHATNAASPFPTSVRFLVSLGEARLAQAFGHICDLLIIDRIIAEHCSRFDSWTGP